MKRFLAGIYSLNVLFQIIAGAGLAFMMGVTLLDITMRAFGRPIIGAVELVSFSGAVVIGFALPYSSWMKSHVIVDLLIMWMSPAGRRVMAVATKLVGFALFMFMGVEFILYGLTLVKTGEVSPGFRIPYYPITFGLSLACFIHALTLLAQLWREPHE